ncbi:MAG: hypothetical protein JKY45_05240 [Emcibacter sp.]|nr:hypothetical protein [Emcibacter sp.]
MKTRKFIFSLCPTIIAVILMTSVQMIPQAMSQEESPDGIRFLQEIQDQLTKVSGLKDHTITVHVITEPKRKIVLTPSSISLSYGFLQHVKSVNQLMATLAHMTAHISLDYVTPPPLPDNIKTAKDKSSASDYLKSAIRPKYPDQTNIPQATGSFHREGPEVLERPRYQNKDYDYAVNKSGIIKAEHELEVDKITNKIIRHAGFCPSDYSRMLHFFYENPQQILGNKHFALTADAWQRLDAVDHRADPKTVCDDDRIARTVSYGPAFDHLTLSIQQALKNKAAAKAKRN